MTAKHGSEQRLYRYRVRPIADRQQQVEARVVVEQRERVAAPSVGIKVPLEVDLPQAVGVCVLEAETFRAHGPWRDRDRLAAAAPDLVDGINKRRPRESIDDLAPCSLTNFTVVAEPVLPWPPNTPNHSSGISGSAPRAGRRSVPGVRETLSA